MTNMSKHDAMVNNQQLTRETRQPGREAGRSRKHKETPRRVPNRRERRKLATRQALIDATNDLLASRSMDALSVDEIAMQADVAKGTFYNYFADKDTLAREIASDVRTRIESEITRANEGVADPAQRIGRAFCCVLALGLSAPKQATAMMKFFPRATDPAAPINLGVRRDVAEGIAQGRLVAPSEDVAIACIVGVFMAGVNRVLDLSGERARAFAQELGTILLHGLGLSRTQAARIMRQAVESILG
jgi:AcrR family transcriptional regulator